MISPQKLRGDGVTAPSGLVDQIPGPSASHTSSFSNFLKTGVRVRFSGMPRLAPLVTSGVLSTQLAGCGATEAGLAALGIHFMLAAPLNLHILFNQRTTPGKISWMTAVTALPFVGPLFYLMAGTKHVPTLPDSERTFLEPPAPKSIPADLPPDAPVSGYGERYDGHLKLSRQVTGRALSANNSVQALYNGEMAYPAMLRAIANAREYIYLGSYIFENNEWGGIFAQALKDAKDRGVDVRILVDSVSKFFTIPTGYGLLKKLGLNVRQFYIPLGFKTGLPLNYRYHAKYMVTDQTAFIGGINIGDNYMVDNLANSWRHKDIHFEVRGSFGKDVVSHFVEEWKLLTGERFDPPEHAPLFDSQNPGALMRLIRSAPDHDAESFKNIILSALGVAREKVRIQTAYFSPDEDLMRAFKQASLRGVQVEIILSGDSFVSLVDWSAHTFYDDLLEMGVDLYYQPSPFDHSKVLNVDEEYLVIGGSNLDYRSMQLNFELNAEIYDRDLAKKLSAHHDKIKAKSQKITLEYLRKQPFWRRFLNGMASLGAPWY